MIGQHQAQFDNLERRIGILYTDRLDRRVDTNMYDSRSGEYRAQQQTILRRIEEIRTSAPAPVEDALKLIKLTSTAARRQTSSLCSGPRRGKENGIPCP